MCTCKHFKKHEKHLIKEKLNIILNDINPELYMAMSSIFNKEEDRTRFT